MIGLKYDETEIDQMHSDAKADFASRTGIDLDAVEKMAANITPEGDPVESEDAPPAEMQGVSSEDTSSPAVGKPSSPQNTERPVTSGPGESKRDTAEVEAILARFYAMQSSYVSQIEGIKSSAYAEYKALPKASRGTSDKIAIGKRAFSKAVALESQCDKQMSELLRELKAALRDAGMDESLADDVKYYYASEKSLLKAQLMSKYKKYLS